MDEIEELRRQRLAELNTKVGERTALEERHGQVWDTAQLKEDFTVRGLAAPFITVIRKSDGQLGSLEFQHNPRYYFNFQPHQN